MKKITKKFAGEFLMGTRCPLNWSVISFDKVTGRRDLAYGGFDFMHAFAVVTTQLSKGFDVIVTDAAGWGYMESFERSEHRRINYCEMKPYEIRIDEYSFNIIKGH